MILGLISTVLVITLAILLYKHFRLITQVKKLESDINMLTNSATDAVKHDSAPNTNEQTKDSVTGLIHRSIFEDRVLQLLNQSNRSDRLFAIIALEIDDFSKISAAESDVGEILLKEVTQRLRMSTRQVDTITRFGIATFLLLLPVLSRPETAIYVAQRVQDNLLDSIIIDNNEYNVTVSMGISVYPIDGDTSTQLLKSATAALQQAKKSGKGKYQFYQTELHDLSSRELSIVELVRSTAFTNQLRVQYKPFIDIEINQPLYIQASAHLLHPQHGMVPFSEVTTLVENAGRTLDAIMWLLCTSVEQLKVWQANNFKPSFLAISVHMQQLENPHFIHELTGFANKLHKLSVQLILEITDDQITQNLDFIENIFSTLSKSNIKISIGVIALAHFTTQKFNKIPIHYLKLDRKLIKDATSKTEKEFILSHIIQLANDESIIVMAEGVDNEYEKEQLKKIGCHVMEGKLFGAILPTGLVLQEEV